MEKTRRRGVIIDKCDSRGEGESYANSTNIEERHAANTALVNFFELNSYYGWDGQ